MLSHRQMPVRRQLSREFCCLQGDVIGCFIHMPEGGRTMEQSKAVGYLLQFCTSCIDLTAFRSAAVT